MWFCLILNNGLVLGMNVCNCNYVNMFNLIEFFDLVVDKLCSKDVLKEVGVFVVKMYVVCKLFCELLEFM